MSRQKNQSSTVCILGYGLFDSSVRNEFQMKGLVNYFLCIVRWIRLDPKISQIFLAGGVTNHLSPQSEGNSAMKFLLEHLGDRSKNLEVYTEGDAADRGQIQGSQSVLQSILACEKYWKEASHTKVFIICDKCRFLRVCFMSVFLRKMLYPQIKFYVTAFKREDDHPNSSWWKQAFRIPSDYLAVAKEARCRKRVEI